MDPLGSGTEACAVTGSGSGGGWIISSPEELSDPIQPGRSPGGDFWGYQKPLTDWAEWPIKHIEISKICWSLKGVNFFDFIYKSTRWGK